MSIKQVTSELKDKYKIVQEKLEREVEDLKSEVTGLKKRIDEKNEEIGQLKLLHEKEVFNKDEQIRDLKRKVDEMSNQFAGMLKETLDKMQQRIEISHWEN